MYIHLLGMGWRCWSKQQPYFHLPHPHGWSKAAPRNGSTPRLAGNSAIWQKQKGKKMQNFHVFHVHSCVKWYLHAHTQTPTHIHTQRCNGVKCIGIRKKKKKHVQCRLFVPTYMPWRSLRLSNNSGNPWYKIGGCWTFQVKGGSPAMKTSLLRWKVAARATQAAKASEWVDDVDGLTLSPSGNTRRNM